MCSRYFVLVVLLVALPSAIAQAEPAGVAENVLTNRLNNLESQSVQRRGRSPTAVDLLNRQDDRIAGQTLNSLKTRTPRNTAIPLLERKLDRSRRPVGSIGRR